MGAAADVALTPPTRRLPPAAQGQLSRWTGLSARHVGVKKVERKEEKEAGVAASCQVELRP